MPKYSEAVIEQIKSRLNVSEVVGSYIKLTRKGDRHWGLCPFHNEKTPSFTVLDSGGFYKCFGCGKGGSMFDFVMEMEHVEFPQAVEILAKKAGIELKEETPQERQKLEQSKALQDLYNRSSEYFHKYLLDSSEAEKARKYISDRGISEETVKYFKLGYATSKTDEFYNKVSKSFSPELLAKSALFSKEYPTFPFFKTRILFPIRNWQGNCVGFSGRDLSGDPKAAKYKNSPETELYSKRNILFGFYESLPSLKKNGEIIICEGNFDVISLHQAGLNYAVAPLGTAFTNEQALLIKRFCTKVNLLFDSDSAGENATKKALLLCQKNNLENYVITFDSAKDASQMLQEQGSEALKKACQNPVSGFTHLVHLALKMYDIRQPKGKTSVFKEVKPYLDATISEIERQGYIKYLSEILKVSEEQILREYRMQRNSDQDANEPEVPSNSIQYNPLKLSLDLNTMLFLVNNRSEFENFRKQVKIDFLDDKAAQELYSVLENAERQQIRTNEMILQMIEDEALKQLVVTSFANGLHKPDNPKEAISNSIAGIKLRRLDERRNGILSLINSSGMENLNTEELKELLTTKTELDREIEDLKKTITEVI